MKRDTKKKARKPGRTQLTLEQDGVDVPALLNWIINTIPRPPTATDKETFLTNAKESLREAAHFGHAPAAIWKAAPETFSEYFEQERVEREKNAARAALYSALAKPDLRGSDTAVRCMAVDAVRIATKRPHYKEISDLLTKAYGVVGTPCVVSQKSLEKLIHDHPLKKGSKLTEFSVHLDHLLPNIKLPE